MTVRATGLPLGAAFIATVDRLKQLAAESYDALLVADGPPHPDYLLLDLCADALHNMTKANGFQKARRELTRPDGPWPESYRRADTELYQQERSFVDAASHQIRAAAKLRATTPAGIYAKALVVRASRSGATKLGITLAEELIDCEELRAFLWQGAPALPQALREAST